MPPVVDLRGVVCRWGGIDVRGPPGAFERRCFEAMYVVVWANAYRVLLQLDTLTVAMESFYGLLFG